MARKKDELRWTPEGQAELAGELAQRAEQPTATKQLAAAIAKAIKQAAPWWTKGLPKCDATGKQAIALAKAWTPRTKLDVRKAALIGTMIGAYESENAEPFVEYILQTKPPAFALAMAGEAWKLNTHYHNPSWPKGTKNCAVWMTEEASDDASMSYGKAQITRYLVDAGDRRPELRAAFLAALDEVLAEAIPIAHEPLICIAGDAKRANESIAKPKTRFGESYLWLVADDVKLIVKHSGGLTYRQLARLGPAAFPIIKKALENRGTGKDARTSLLVLAQNLHGPKTARLFAEYVTMTSQRPQVVAYFKRYPELLTDVLADPKCAEDHPYLEPLVSSAFNPSVR